jgi:hypothetical protein
MEREHCTECDGETGKAGRSEGSLYLLHARTMAEVGPLCEPCHDNLLADPDETYIAED